MAVTSSPEPLPRLLIPDAAVTGSDAAASPLDGERWQQLHPGWLYRAVEAGEIIDTAGGATAHRVELHELGTLELADGRLIACDPYLADDATPAFTRALPAGDHRVLVAIAAITDEHRPVLAAIVVSGAAPITRWEPARTPGGEDQPPEVGAYYGYPVDTGTGCFLSPAALPALAAAMQADAGMLEDPVSLALDLSADGTALTTLGAGGPTVAAFRSGWGDGVYPTWLGLSADGSVVVAMSDFLLVGDPWEPAPERSAAAGTAPRPAVHSAPEAGEPVTRDPSDGYAGRITAEEAAAELARARRTTGHRSGFWARLFGQR